MVLLDIFQDCHHHPWGWSDSVKDNVPHDVPHDVPLGLSLDDIILNAIRENNNVTRAAIAKMANVSQKTIGRRIKELSAIRYIGSGNNGHWEIVAEKSENPEN